MKKQFKPKKIIGAKIKTLTDIRSKGGECIAKGEICTIVGSYRGYHIRTDDHRDITRVSPYDVEFIKDGQL